MKLFGKFKMVFLIDMVEYLKFRVWLAPSLALVRLIDESEEQEKVIRR